MPRRGKIAAVQRRAVLSVALAAGLASLGAGGVDAARAATMNGREWTRLRRVVTSNGPDGRGVVLFDGEPNNTLVMNGTRIVRLWETPTVPAVTPLTEDLGATAGNAYRDGFNGASYYVAELPGGARAVPIPLHATPSLDFMAILAGRVVLILETGEVTLRRGDTLVQGGNLHGWENRWRAPCLLLFVVLRAVVRDAARP